MNDHPGVHYDMIITYYKYNIIRPKGFNKTTTCSFKRNGSGPLTPLNWSRVVRNLGRSHLAQAVDVWNTPPPTIKESDAFRKPNP